MIIKENTKSASRYKISSLNEQFNRFQKFLEAEDMLKLSMYEFDDHCADQYRCYMDEELDLSVKTINASLSYLFFLWKYAVKKMRWCTSNPFDSVDRMKKNQKKIKDERFEPLTSSEIDTIMKRLNSPDDVNYKIFLGMIFYAWARPAEIARIKVSDIDLKRDLVRFSRADTKNKEGGFVQIVPPLKK